MKRMGGVEMQLHTHILTFVLDRVEWSVSSPDHFTSEERVPCTHWVGSWVGPGVDLDTVEKIKILSLPLPAIELRSSHSSHYTD